MADGEHLASQTRNIWLADKSRPYEGTEKHPQGRLFAPTGGYTGDPWKLAPENWLGQSDTPAHDDIVSWHSSEESTLPRSDEYEHRQHEPGYGTGPDWGDDDDEEEYGDDFSVDAKDRPMGEYGSVVGMHFGNIKAATDRSPRPYVHPARIPNETLADPPRGTFMTERAGGSISGGPFRSDREIVNAETGERTKDTRWTDSAANYSLKGTDAVEEGKTLAYRNDVEAQGSTSYRTLPETARTWSEDVMQARNPLNGRPASEKYGWTGDEHAFRNKPHPALVHLAEKGYDPVVLRSDKPSSGLTTPVQLSFGDLTQPDGTPSEDYQIVNKSLQRSEGAARSRTADFEAGRTARLRKPGEGDKSAGAFSGW